MLSGRRHPDPPQTAARWAARRSHAQNANASTWITSCCVVGFLLASAFDGSRALAGCGDYIHFRGSGIAASGDVARNSLSATVRNGNVGDRTRRDGESFSGNASRGLAAMAHLLGLRLAAPLDDHQLPCHGPACQQRPVSPTVPATALVWLESHDAIILNHLASASPSTRGCRLEGEAALLPVRRPSAIFRPPR